MFLSIFYIIILAINQFHDDFTFWSLNFVTSVFLFLIFCLIHIKIEEKYYKDSISKLNKIESKKKDKYHFFMEIGSYIGAFAAFALIFIVILIPSKEKVLSSTLIWLFAIVLIICLFFIIYGFSKSTVENSTD